MFSNTTKKIQKNSEGENISRILMQVANIGWQLQDSFKKFGFSDEAVFSKATFYIKKYSNTRICLDGKRYHVDVLPPSIKKEISWLIAFSKSSVFLSWYDSKGIAARVEQLYKNLSNYLSKVIQIQDKLKESKKQNELIKWATTK